jgi:hypothetical protein
MFTDIGGVLANLSGLGEVKRLSRLVEGLLRVHGGVEDDLALFSEHNRRGQERADDRSRCEHREIERALALGASHFLAKPHNFEGYKEVVRAVWEFGMKRSGTRGISMSAA